MEKNKENLEKRPIDLKKETENSSESEEYTTNKKGLKDSRFRKAAFMSLKLWQNLGHTQLEIDNMTSNYSTILLIEDIIDLEIEKNLKSFLIRIAQDVLPEDLNYNPYDVLNNFLECEKQNG
ncbi:12266_t:CDS:2 [Cetraspora pellucida]|uniref:12266_t:CDS:1 n=1 Tax=Cetraspora pellucida TaxID=1433469 RepID=A0A9N9GWX8_9GLOM|nr:12266_t:CDS:2 [Cetraspora pellucida]